MKKRNFSVTVVTASETAKKETIIDGMHYVVMQDGESFGVRIQSFEPRLRNIYAFQFQGQDMMMTEDGAKLDGYFVPADNDNDDTHWGPMWSQKGFAFYRTNSEVGKSVHLGDIDPNDRGLITVRIWPEIDMGLTRGSTDSRSIVSGGAVLEGEKKAEVEIRDYDEFPTQREPIVFHIRLVGELPMNEGPAQMIPPSVFPDPVQD